MKINAESGSVIRQTMQCASSKLIGIDTLPLLPCSPAVVTELDHVVLVAMLLGAHNEAEERVLLLLPINHHPPPIKHEIFCQCLVMHFLVDTTVYF